MFSACIARLISTFSGLKLQALINAQIDANNCLEWGEKISREEYFNEIGTTLGIEVKLNNRITELSGGQQQRVAIARALITKPSLLCADEPTGNLDKNNTVEVMRLLKKINSEQKTTILLITHDSNVAEYADKVIRIEDGRIEQHEDSTRTFA